MTSQLIIATQWRKTVYKRPLEEEKNGHKLGIDFNMKANKSCKSLSVYIMILLIVAIPVHVSYSGSVRRDIQSLFSPYIHCLNNSVALADINRESLTIWLIRGWSNQMSRIRDTRRVSVNLHHQWLSLSTPNSHFGRSPL